MRHLPTLLALLAAAFALAAVVAFLTDQLLVAGVLMFATSFTIYLRETRT